MTRDNILFSIIGVLLGVIVGYAFATNINRRESGVREAAPPVVAAQGQGLPEDHPPITGATGSNPTEAPGTDAGLIEKALAEPDNFEAQIQAAGVHYRNRRFDEATEILERAIRLRPKDRNTIVFLGNSNFDAGRYEVAEKWYTAALEMDQKDLNVRTDLGLTFLFRVPPDPARAAQEFRRSLEIDPDHEQTLQNLVVALTKKGDYDQAEATLKKLSKVNPANQSLTKLRADLEAARSSAKGSPQQPAGKSK